jgi:hypothetical protein
MVAFKVGVKIRVSDGFRISSDHDQNQEDQSVADADRGETQQNLRKSATSRNQGSGEGQAIQPSLAPLLHFRIQGVALAA